MTSIQPEGVLLIVFPLKKEDTETKSGIVIQDFILNRGEVLEVSPQYEGKYNKGDIILYPEDSGKSIFYQKKPCLWIDGRGFPDGEVFGIEK